jgi:ABC-2 type transport system ATP-binding protein
MLEIRSLRKSFGALVAVDDVSFTVDPGQLVGLLGPNRAGKTTTVSMIAGVGRPDRGNVLIDGRRLAGDADPAKRRLGLVPQDDPQSRNAIFENLEVLSRYSAASRRRLTIAG